MSAEGHFCWEHCDEGPHGCVCGNDCPNPVSVADEAFDEVKRRVEMVPMGDEADVQFAAGFIEGAEWQASRKVEVTEEDVEAAKIAVDALEWGAEHGGDDPSTDDIVRAALDAVTARHTKGDKA